MSEFKTISKQFWGRHFWGRGYFAASSGNVTDEVIMEYINSLLAKNLIKKTVYTFSVILSY